VYGKFMSETREETCYVCLDLLFITYNQRSVITFGKRLINDEIKV
jgi:hypothetical protein